MARPPLVPRENLSLRLQPSVRNALGARLLVFTLCGPLISPYRVEEPHLRACVLVPSILPGEFSTCIEIQKHLEKHLQS